MCVKCHHVYDGNGLEKWEHDPKRALGIHNAIRPNNVSGVPGVHLHKATGTWRVQVKRVSGGVYQDKKDAIKARNELAREIYGPNSKDYDYEELGKVTMCIMSIHQGADKATMAQAHAHNLSTVDRDCEMFSSVLNARKDFEGARTVTQLQQVVHRAYAGFLELFGEYAAEITPNGIHSHDRNGNERSLEEVIESATREARKDETR
jgi:hypothetical protein